ncbi:MAG: hypothetical protein ACOYB7_16195 [Mycobacterium sp.]
MQPETNPIPSRGLVESLADVMNLPDRMGVAALDQMSWHLFCCHYLFDGFSHEIQSALKTAVDQQFLSEIGAGIAQLRAGVETTMAEISVMHFDRRYVSSAEAFQDELDATSDPEMIFFPTANPAPQCQKVIGKGVRPCTRPVLYIGGGEWSEGCETHASSGDRDRHKQWDHARDGISGGAAQIRRSRQLTDVARVLLDWWPTIEALDSLIRDALRDSQT